MAEEIQNPIEHSTFRSEWVLNQPGGTFVINNSTGEERVQLSHDSGGNIRFDNKCTSWFAPFTNQINTLGQSYITTGGDSFERVVKHKEIRVNRDFTVITGDDKFFTDDVASDYVEAYRDIAAAQTAPELQYGACSNNTQTQFSDGGTPEPKSGAVSGGSYPANPNSAKVQQLKTEKTPQLTELEKNMGVGGSIKLISCKHLYFHAGAGSAINYDSGRCIPNGQDIVKRWKWSGGGDRDQYGADNSGNSHEEERTSAPIYEAVDTSSAMPFGDIHLNALGKLNFQSGSGGLSIQTAGEAKVTTTGRLTLGGHEVAIGGGSKGDTGTVRVTSDTAVITKAGDVISNETKFINNTGSTQITHITPMFHCTNDVHIERDLRVQRNCHIQGNLHVHGDITCNGHITCDKDLTVKGSSGILVTQGDVRISRGGVYVDNEGGTDLGVISNATIRTYKDVISDFDGRNVSLNDHTHGGVDNGSGNTAVPN